MEVLLLEEIDNLGEVGDVVQVKTGYFRNYLYPKGLADMPTKANMQRIEEKRRIILKEKQLALEKAKKIAEEIDGITVTLKVKCGENNKLYGSITNQDIVDALEKQKIDVDKKKIAMEKHIKELGIYTVPIKLAPEVEAKIKVLVEPEEE